MRKRSERLEIVSPEYLGPACVRGRGRYSHQLFMKFHSDKHLHGTNLLKLSEVMPSQSRNKACGMALAGGDGRDVGLDRLAIGATTRIGRNPRIVTHQDTSCQAKFPGSRQKGTWDRPSRR